MAAKTKVKPERDFQEVANEYAHRSIETMREELDDESQRENICSEGALSVEVRTDWYIPGQDSGKPSEYKILLGWGGPAAQITGELNEYCQPTTAQFQYQDWFKPWTTAQTTCDEDATLLEYARQFYFGE